MKFFGKFKKNWKIWKILENLEIFGLPWSSLICLGLLRLFRITIDRLKCLKDISGMDGRKSLKALILRAPLCGANNHLKQTNKKFSLIKNSDWARQTPPWHSLNKSPFRWDTSSQSHIPLHLSTKTFSF